MNANRIHAIVCLMFSLFVFLFFNACTSTTKETLTPERDMAETLAGALAVNSGGIMDQMADLCEFLTPDADKMPESASYGDNSRYITMHKTYNDATQEWEITYEKVRGSYGVEGYAHIIRQYTLKYMDSEGNPQKFYVNEADTARFARFKAMHGSGEHKTRRIVNRLDSLYSDWSISNANEEYVSLNGMYYRAGVDTISGWNRLRISNHYMLLNFSEFSMRRAQHMNAYQYHSGSVTGTCNAAVEFIEGTPYSGTTISDAVNVLIGNGRGEITLNSKEFSADLAAGELID